MKLQVRVSEAYGRKIVYPVNEEAKSIAKLLRRESFTSLELRELIKQGHEIEIVPSHTLDDLIK